MSAEIALREARSWLGTPYIHQASCKGAGCDCLGLIRGIWRALYHSEPCPTPAYSPDWAEAQSGEPLYETACKTLILKNINDAALGDVLLFRMKDQARAKHLGLQSQLGGNPQFIHAYSGHHVMESPFNTPWQRRLVARFSFP